MEEILEIYQRPYNSKFPVVCMDESTKQCVSSCNGSLSLTPKKGVREDYEYERNGVGHLFMFFEPMRGYRHVDVYTSHTRKEWVEAIVLLMKSEYESAEKVTFVLDNLSTHNPKFFYEFLPAGEARRLLNRMEFKYTPKHASWLNIAEIAFSVLSKECLNRRIPSIEILREEIYVWEVKKNKQHKKVNWRFTSSDARIKLKKFYPLI